MTFRGLRGIIAAETALSEATPAGELRLRGYDIAALAEAASYEAVVKLLWDGDLPSAADLRAFEAALKARRTPPGFLLNLLRDLPPATPPMAALRIAISALPEADGRDLVALAPVLIAAHHRMRRELAPVPPDLTLGHAANFLWMLRDRPPTAQEARALDVALLLLAEMSLNPSTFALRIAASTEASLPAAVATALAVLSGPRHGGAGPLVMPVLRAIGTPERAGDYVEQERAAGRKIAGFGHRVFRAPDPRAAVLREVARDLSEVCGDLPWYEVAQALRHEMAARLDLHINVDFYYAPTFCLLGIPDDLHTALFAAARIAGWVAHYHEQRATERIIWPEARYIGPEARSL